MPVEQTSNGYSAVTGLIYVYNLVVGTGALALPGVVSKAGYIPGSILIILLGFFSYITVTFIIETQSAANEIDRIQEHNNEEDHPLLQQDGQQFEMAKKYEFTELASVLLSTPSKMIVSVCLILYLIGDLAIYCAVLAKTLSHTTCTYHPDSFSCNATLPDSLLCWEGSILSRGNVYQIWVCCFVCFLGPFIFFNLQKTKVLQMLTSVMRWVAFTIMITWSIILIKTQGPVAKPVIEDFKALPVLFGTCVYSFMCQHSVPGLVHPITNKTRFMRILPADYVIISAFYTLLSVTAVFAFDKIEDVYTLNFWSETCSPMKTNSTITTTLLQYYLALFPVFTLSTSFPIIGITLKNNLSDLFGVDSVFFKRFVIPLGTLIVPTLLALFVPNVQILVGFVGSYAGSGLQYLAPCLLISAARQKCRTVSANPFQSPFRSKYWIYLVYLWMAISLILITIHHVIDLSH